MPARRQTVLHYARLNASCLLGVTDSNDAVEHLIAATEDDSAGVREHAAWALEAVGDHRGVPALLALLEYEIPEVRETASWDLGAIGDESAVNPLIKHLRSDDDNDMRRKAMWALTAI